ncbi:hypothetical protein Patl1_35171 [Pistacia atlantica]|uniref:Uncharacterized protein n=1 Tax=Pistacia atlantica TaxID=434234 RepID=A0ACC0ZQ54_9ROSI|nr:hypothetical protein Patl1_35171 [Pistacia atlantica]
MSHVLRRSWDLMLFHP